MPKEMTSTVSLVEEMHFHGENSVGVGTELNSVPQGQFAAGATPMELLLQCAGACSLMDIAVILRKRRLPPSILQAILVGTRRDEHPKIFTKIEVNFRAKGEGITIEELDKAAALSLSTYCSVFGMLQKVAKVTYRCEILP